MSFLARLSPKRLAIAGYGLFALVVALLLTVPPADGYEISMYAAYPWVFWVALFLAFLVSQLLVLRAAVRPDSRDGYWRLGFLLAMLGTAVMVFMPYLRGYSHFERADVLTHIGYIQVIQESGRVGVNNIYPNIHNLVLTLSYATGVEPIRIINAISGILSLFAVAASFALLARAYGRQKALFTIPFVMVLFAGTASMNPSPYSQSRLILVFLLYVFVLEQYTRSLSVRIALAVSLVGLVLYHPLTTLFLLGVFLVYSLVGRLWYRDDADGTAGTAAAPGSATASHLLGATYVAWYYNFAGLFRRVRTLYERVFGPSEGETTLQTYSSTVTRTSPALLDLIRIGVLRYGYAAIILSVAGLHFLRLNLHRVRGQMKAGVFESTFSATFVLFSGLTLVFLFLDFVVGFTRPLAVAQFFAALVAGALFFWLYTHSSRKSMVAIVLVVLLASLVVVSMFGLFKSPQRAGVNQQVTAAELDGAEWYFANRNAEMPIQERGITLYRFEDALFGTDADLLGKEGDGTRPPDHFGYTENGTFGQSFEQDHYFVSTRLGRIFYPEVYPDYPQFWRFTDADFDRLERDPTTSQVYTNGGFEMYLINGTAPDT